MKSSTRRSTARLQANRLAHLFAEAVQQHRAGRLAEAERLYRRIIALDDESAQGYSHLGALFKSQGRLADGQSLYERALVLKPDYGEALYNLANASTDQGSPERAARLYRRAISVRSDYAEAHNNLGNLLRDQGRVDDAAQCYARALVARPDIAELHVNLAAIRQVQGRFREAVACYRRAVSLRPDLGPLCSNLGAALEAAGRVDEAILCHRRAIGLQPRDATAYVTLGLALVGLGRMIEAVTAFERSVALNPDSAEAHYALANGLRARGTVEPALAHYRRALELDPHHIGACNNLGNLLQSQGRTEAAVACYGHAIACRPDYAEAYSNVGHALRSGGRLEEAERWCRRALVLEPGLPVLHANLGFVLAAGGRHAEAVAWYEQALAMVPEDAETNNSLGLALVDLGRAEEGLARFRQALCLRPDYVEALCNLANGLKDQGLADEAVALYERVLVIQPDFAVAHSNLLLLLNYSAAVTAERIYAEHRRWSERHARAFGREARPHANVRDPRRRLRIGYVSPDFRQHSVAYFLEPLLKCHDPGEVEVFCYAEVVRPDATTARLRELSDHWLVTVGSSDGELAERIRSDGIDILVDLAGHTAGNRLLVLARRPAPVQVTWLGYPNTTGLDAIDYRVVDPITDPPEGLPRASEALFRLEGGFLCYEPPGDAGEPGSPPCMTTGSVTFGSFNNPAKLSATTLDVWAAVLSRVGNSGLLLKGLAFADPVACERLLGQLAGRGVAAERVTLLARIPEAAGHLAAYRQIDVGLDPFPYNGTTTTCEALWMGVPVVTLAGSRHAGRVGASLLSTVGLNELAADDVTGYVETAAALAEDPARLAGLRGSLRRRLAASSLCDAPLFARRIEAAYRRMWQRWCEGGNPRPVL